MAFHPLELNRASLHGHFSRELPPALTIQSGDTVRFQTLDAGWGLEQYPADGSPRRLFTPRDPEQDSGHALCGPVFVEGAEPGMTLEVRIDAVQPGAWGWTLAGGWDSLPNRRLGVAGRPQVTHQWALDTETMTGTNQHGHEVTLRPFLGVMGMPADVPGGSRPRRRVRPAATWTAKSWSPEAVFFFPSRFGAASFPPATATPRRATAKSARWRWNARWSRRS